MVVKLVPFPPFTHCVCVSERLCLCFWDYVSVFLRLCVAVDGRECLCFMSDTTFKLFGLLWWFRQLTRRCFWERVVPFCHFYSAFLHLIICWSVLCLYFDGFLHENEYLYIDFSLSVYLREWCIVVIAPGRGIRLWWCPLCGAKVWCDIPKGWAPDACDVPDVAREGGGAGQIWTTHKQTPQSVS